MGLKQFGSSTAPLVLNFFKDGESHEGDGRHESHACHEEEDCERDCKGQICKGLGASWNQGKDCWWLDRLFFDQEQARTCRQQEAVLEGKEERLDDCSPEGKEGTEDQGLLRSEERNRVLQEGQVLHVKTFVRASAQGVGISTSLERRRLNRG